MPRDNNENIIKDFRTENWYNKSFDQKMESLQKLEDSMAAKQNRLPRTVRTVNMSNETRGYYNQKDPQYLNINKKMVESQNPDSCSNYHSMQNIIHEGRHAYQDDAMLGRIEPEAEDKSKIDNWAKNSSAYGGVYNSGMADNGQDSDQSFVDYRFQPKESDANNYTKKEMDVHANALHDDKNYTYYKLERDYNDQLNAKTAELYYGDDYEEKIAQSIDKKYQMKNQMKESEGKNMSYNMRAELNSQTKQKSNSQNASSNSNTNTNTASQSKSAKYDMRAELKGQVNKTPGNTNKTSNKNSSSGNADNSQGRELGYEPSRFNSNHESKGMRR